MARARNMYSRVCQSIIEGVKQMIFVCKVVECANSFENSLVTFAYTL